MGCCRLFFFLWTVLVLCSASPLRGSFQRMETIAIRCDPPPPRNIYTCRQHLRHVEEEVFDFLDNVIPHLIHQINETIVWEAHVNNFEEPTATNADDLPSLFTTLTHIYMDLTMAEYFIRPHHHHQGHHDHGQHSYSTAICGPLQSMAGALRMRQFPSSFQREVAESCFRRDERYPCAMHETRKARIALITVYRNLRSACRLREYCSSN